MIGAGLTGLAAGWELRRAGAETTLLEGDRRVGGVILTEHPDGFVVEGGPDGFLAAEPEIPLLAGDLGVAGRLVDQLTRGSSLWNGQQLEPLEEGRAAALLGIPEPAHADLRKGFRTFAGGMAEVIDALAKQLGDAVHVGSPVATVATSRRGYRLTLPDTAEIEVDAVVLALPAWELARLLEGLGAPGGRELAEVPYAPSITVSLGYLREQVPAQLEGTGFVSSPEWRGSVRACTYASLKYPGRAPRGSLLLRAFLGSPSSDADPARLAHEELARMLGINGSPLWARVFTWPRGIPRYKAGHADYVAGLRAGLARLPPVAIAGAAVDGAGVSACVRSGRQAARTVLTRLSVPSPS